MPPAPRTGRASRAARREEVLARLIEVVERLLDAGEDYAELTVDRLVREAGISRSTFYFHFQDKGELLRAVTQGVQADFVGVVRGWSRASAADITPEELARMLGAVVDAFRAHERLLAAVMDAAGYDLGVREAFLTMVREIEQDLAEHLRAGRAAGDLPADLDAEATAGWIVWMIERGLQQLVRGASDAQAARLTAALARLVAAGVYVR